MQTSTSVQTGTTPHDVEHFFVCPAHPTTMIPSVLWSRQTDAVRELSYPEARDPDCNEHGLKGEQQHIRNITSTSVQTGTTPHDVEHFFVCPAHPTTMIPSVLWSRQTDAVRELSYPEARDPDCNEHGLKGEQQHIRV